MAGKCKVCACDDDTRTRIEDRLRIGDSVNDIAADLKTFGIHISGMSVMRHRDNHMDEFRREGGDKKYSLDDVKGNGLTIDVDGILGEIEEELLDKDYQESATLERLKTQVLLERICQKQLVIVDQLQERYIEGKGGYPNDQIRGLKIILEMISGLPPYKDSDIKSGLDIINNNVQMKREVKHGYDAMTKYASLYKPGDLFRDNGSDLPKNPHHPTIGAYQEANAKHTKWNEGIETWLLDNPNHRLATDFEVWNYINMTFDNDLESLLKFMDLAGKQKRPSLEWIKSVLPH